MTMKRKNMITWLIFLGAVPATLLLGSKLPGRWYYLTGTLMILELLIPFFLTFEGRKPQARELVMLAVMCALAVAARVAIPIPNFKAIYGIIMIAGISFGPEYGFLVGAISALSSNFFMGQGPYTPWQMVSYGTGGMLMGYLFQMGRLSRKPLLMGSIGALITLLIIGPILDTCTLFLAPVKLSWKTISAIYLSGAVVNLSLSVSTFLVLFLLGSPLLQKLERVKTKYGMMENE
jgi:energy-coupling factor transport system substrate-specific component